MAPESAVERFRRILEKVFAGKTERIEDQIDFDHKYQHLYSKEYEALIKLVIATKSTDGLDPLMKAYMGLWERYRQNTNAVRFYRSDQLFEILIEQSGRVAIGDVDLFEIYAPSIKTGQPSPSLRERFLALSSHVQSKVLAFIETQKEKRRATRSILDILREEYRKRYTFLPQANSDLYDFDPYPSETFKLACERQVTAVVTAWNACLAKHTEDTVRALHRALDAFRDHVRAAGKHGWPQILQVVKYLLDRLRDRREGGYAMNEGQPATKVIHGDRSGVIHELYSIALLQLIVQAAGKRLARNRGGLTDAEKSFFLDPIDGYAYASNIRARFNVGTTRMDALFDQSKYFLGVLLVAHHYLPNMTPVDLRKILEIQAFWKPIYELAEKLERASPAERVRLHADPKNRAVLETLQKMMEIDVGATTGPELGKGPLRIGDIPGSTAAGLGRIKIVYVNPANPEEVFVEVDSLKPQLFRVTRGYVQSKLYGSRILEIHKSTIGMVYVTQFQIMAVMFLPVLIEGGFAALIYEVGVYFASTKVEEAVAKVDPKAGKVAGFLALAFTPRPNFKPKVNVPVARAKPSVLLLDAAQAESRRSFAEILKAGREEAPLIADLNRSTVAKAKDKIVDKVLTLPSKEAVAGRLDAVAERLPFAEPVTTTGLTFRTRGARATGGTGRGGGSGRAATPQTLGNSRLAKSEKLKQIESYYELLTKEEALLAKKEVNAIFDELNRGVITYSQASQRLTNVLNGAKEVTGEYVADGVIYSNFTVIQEIAIPYRKNGVPMLDKVYKVRNEQTGQIDYLLVEVKGGERTRLGKLTAKQFQPTGGKIVVTVDPNRMVKQGTGEWYYQKMVEIFEAEAIAADRATAARMQKEFKALAREMFDYAKKGGVQTAIVKSGRKLDPYVTITTDEAAAFFKNIESPFP